MRRLSEAEKAEMWDRFELGESLRSISRRLGRRPSTIGTHVMAGGFHRPLPAGEWSPMRLSLGEREEISRDLINSALRDPNIVRWAGVLATSTRLT